MKAIRIHEWGAGPVVEDIDEPLRAMGQTLVQVQAATVSHLDLTIASGTFVAKPPLPYVPGGEASGIVLESETQQVGSQVIVRGAGLGVTTNGTWQERVVVPDTAVVALRADLDPAVAAACFIPATTAYVALHDIGQLQSGETVIVTGAAGAVGGMAAQLALRVGANVIGVVSTRERLGDLPVGVTGVSLDDAEAVDDLRTRRAADLLIDTIGGPDLLAHSFWVKPGGRCAILGYTAGSTASIDLPSWFFHDVSLLPVSMITRGRRALQIGDTLQGSVADGSLQIAVERISISGITAAIARLRQGTARGRPVICF